MIKRPKFAVQNAPGSVNIRSSAHGFQRYSRDICVAGGGRLVGKAPLVNNLPTRKANPVDLRHAPIDTWIFDLDNTLYPETCSLFDEINHKMNLYMADLLDLKLEDASDMRQGFYERHGTTLNGLMHEYGANPYPFLDFVHDVDLSRLDPAPNLKPLLADLPGRCLVHTNGTVAHAQRVLKRLGIEKCFDGIFDIIASQFQPKPGAPAFAGFIEAFDVTPHTSIMFEDKEENLKVPHELGMTTVWINQGSQTDNLPVYDHVHHLSDTIGGFLEEPPDGLGSRAGQRPG